MTFHYIEFTVYCHATEKPQRVEKALHNVVGKDIELEETEAEGHYGNTILILQGKISRNREMDSLFDRLPSSVIEELRKTVEERTDEYCNFFFRLDKEKAYDEELSLAEGDNTIKIRARVESYPAKRKKAVEKMKDYLSQKL